MTRGWWTRATLLGGVAALLVGAGTTVASARPDARGASAATINVGVIYSRTGALAGFGAEYAEGFRQGLAYARRTTRNCGGHKFTVTFVDDQTNPANAVNAAKDLIGKGYKIITGSTSSGSALQVAPVAEQNKVLFISGAAASDAITGLNRYTFRAGRQSYQDVMTARNFLPARAVGRKIVVFAEDTAFGASNVAAIRDVFGGKGHTVSAILAPFQAADLTPQIQQLRNANADLVFVAWAGSNAPAMWNGLRQQGVMRSTTVVTGLPDRVSYPTLGPMFEGAKLLSHYVYQGPKNKVNKWLIAQLKRKRMVPDLFTPDGFVTAQMVCRAVQKGSPTDVERMISALEGWQFVAPKGVQRIRQKDHAMIQPMFQVELVRQRNGTYEPKVLKTVSPGNVQPPVKPFG